MPAAAANNHPPDTAKPSQKTQLDRPQSASQTTPFANLKRRWTVKVRGDCVKLQPVCRPALQLATSSGNRQSSQTRIRVFAKIADDLHQTLLRRRALATRGSFDPVPSKRCRASFKTELSSAAGQRNTAARFRWPADFFISAFGRARPQPRQNHIHRQIRHARLAQQRLRLLQPRRSERPVPRPEFIAFDLENFAQRIRQLLVGHFRRAPVFNF